MRTVVTGRFALNRVIPSSAQNSASGIRARSMPNGSSGRLRSSAARQRIYPTMQSGTHSRLKGSETTDCTPNHAMTAGSVASWAAMEAQSVSAR